MGYKIGKAGLHCIGLPYCFDEDNFDEWGHKSNRNHCSAMVLLLLWYFQNNSQYSLGNPVHLADLIHKRFHIVDKSIWRILRIDPRRVQYDDLDAIRPQSFQHSRQTSGLVSRLAKIRQASWPIENFSHNIDFLTTHSNGLQFLQSSYKILFCPDDSRKVFLIQ